MFGNLMTKLYLKRIEKKGFVHGKNFDIEKGANIDANFCDLIMCGDNVTLAKDVYILAHDASMKKTIGKAKIGRVKIGNNVFIGARTVILPGIEIGDNVVIGANSTVTQSIPEGEVWAGTPARFISKQNSFIEKHKTQLNESAVQREAAREYLKTKKYAYID